MTHDQALSCSELDRQAQGRLVDIYGIERVYIAVSSGLTDEETISSLLTIHDENLINLLRDQPRARYISDPVSEAIKFAAASKDDGGLDVYFVTSTEDRARAFIINSSSASGNPVAGPYRLDFPSGNFILSGTKAHRMRGKGRCYAILDRAPDFDLGEWAKVTASILMCGGRVRVVSRVDPVVQWEEFRATGALAAVNLMLNDFGWHLVLVPSDAGDTGVPRRDGADSIDDHTQWDDFRRSGMITKTASMLRYLRWVLVFMPSDAGVVVIPRRVSR